MSPATVFNYFATKQDLFFGEVERLEQELADLVAAVPPGDSIWSALQGHVVYELTAGRAYTDPHAVGPFHAILAASPGLRAREAEIYERRVVVLTQALCDAGAGTDDLECRRAAVHAAEQLAAAELRRRLTGRRAPRRVLNEVEELVGQSLRDGAYRSRRPRRATADKRDRSDHRPLPGRRCEVMRSRECDSAFEFGQTTC